MNYNSEKNNKVYLYGEIVSEAKFSHEVYGEGFYEFLVKVMRLSGQADILPVTVSERIMTESMGVGSHVCALGQFRSYNKLEEGKSRLMQIPPYAHGIRKGASRRTAGQKPQLDSAFGLRLQAARIPHHAVQ